MPTNPLVFISYAQFDDEFEGGALHRFRDALSGTLRFVSGSEIAVFHERTDVALGQRFQERISQSLNKATVLVPVVTPSFFNDPNCREILARFLERERQLGRNDLVLAVYYQQVPGLEDAEAQANDELLRDLARRRMLDWQPLRGKDFKDPQVRRELERMARRIIDILDELEKMQAQVQSSPDGQSQPQPARQLTMPEVTQLASLLLPCPAMQDTEARKTLLEMLPAQIFNSIRHHASNQVHVLNIVRTCNNFPGGLDALIEAVRFFDGGTLCMQAVDAFWNNLS